LSYYKSNALYDYLKENQYTQYKFTSGDLWQLIYGDNNCDPKLLVLASGVDHKQYLNNLSQNEKEGLQLLKKVSEITQIPLRFVRFIIDSEEVDEVITFRNDEKPIKVKMNQLKDLFHQEGLPVSDSATDKYLNDASSSAYHNWQRNSLGRDIKVSDFDLWKVDHNGKPIELYELKRSYYALDRWKPFSDDYSNFRLIHKVVAPVGIHFKIVYNVRTKNPWNDNISKLKIFEVDFDQEPPINQLGIIELSDFLS
jgi:hypothetical protein